MVVLERLEIGNGGKFSCVESDTVDQNPDLVLHRIKMEFSDRFSVKANGRVWCNNLDIEGKVTFEIHISVIKPINFSGAH